MDRSPPDHDVLVAGAGPAGVHVALRLAARGFDVALLDKRCFPRAKPCGEFLSPECLPLLDEVGLRTAVLDAGPSAVAGMRLHGFGRRAVGRYVRVGSLSASTDYGLALRREALDLLGVLRARATSGCTVLEGWSVCAPLFDDAGRVRGLAVRDPDGAARELTARFVVGADGLKSAVARGLGWSRRDPWLDRWALVARFRGVPQQREAEVHFLDGAYFAAAPIDSAAFTANLVVDRAALPRGAANLPALFFDHVARAPVLAARLAHATLDGPIQACGPLAARTTRRAAPGVALVGDACGFVDPLTGEGLYFAMRGAALLADAVERALHVPRRERRALRAYEHARQRELGPRYALARLLQRGIRHPAVVERVLAMLARRPGLADLVVTWTGDTTPPSTFLLPRTWRGALRAPENAA